MSDTARVDHKHHLTAKLTEFSIPPVHDGLVLGKKSPIGCVAIRKALELLIASPFEHIELQDDILSDIIVRQAILRRIPRAKLVAFVLDEIKPLMGPEEILHLDLKSVVTVGGIL